MIKDSQHCWDCWKLIAYTEEETYDMNDIIEGQYEEYKAVRCKACGIENRVYYT